MVNAAWHPALTPLFVPADRPERFAKAAASGADAVILDLEDAVAPPDKAAARLNVAAHTLSGLSVVVRINAHGTADFAADMAALRNARFDAVMLPKAETAADVEAVAAALGRPVPVLAIVETARGLDGMRAVLTAPGLAQAAFGSMDFALDMGCTPTWEALLMARSQVVLHSRLAGKPAPLDAVTTSLDDAALIESEARRAAEMGFGGKLLIHPRQVEPARRGFLPDDKSLAWARRVLAAADTGSAAGAVRVDGAMVDRPLMERARKMVELVQRLPATTG
jgi:citrate lyase subunit beta/citryl-CoA lyase